jgi:hypothetical protein
MDPPGVWGATVNASDAEWAAIYRVLAERGESKERRNQRLPQPHTKPSLTATAPNQGWTWDITKFATREGASSYNRT